MVLIERGSVVEKGNAWMIFSMQYQTLLVGEGKLKKIAF